MKFKRVKYKVTDSFEGHEIGDVIYARLICADESKALLYHKSYRSKFSPVDYPVSCFELAKYDANGEFYTPIDNTFINCIKDTDKLDKLFIKG